MSNISEQESRAAYTSQQQNKSNEFRAGLRPRPDEKQVVRRGKITKAVQSVTEDGSEWITIGIRFDDMPSDFMQTSFKNGFILSQPVEEIALLYGSLDDLVGLTVSVETSSSRKDTGIATIISDNGRGNLDKFHTLKPFGTLLAPAGN